MCSGCSEIPARVAEHLGEDQGRSVPVGYVLSKEGAGPPCNIREPLECGVELGAPRELLCAVVLSAEPEGPGLVEADDRLARVGSLLALYLAYTPYWYAGIMGWHYVFESAPLWCLLVAGVTGDVWQRSRHTTGSVLPLAWIGMLLICPLTGFAEFEPVWSPSRIDAAVSEVGFARRRHADFQEKVARRVGDRRALVLVQADPADRHIDHVVNSPSLDAHVLVGRYVPGLVPMSRVLALFPDRGIFVFDARSGRMREVRR